jgi:hypothetical protein
VKRRLRLDGDREREQKETEAPRWQEEDALDIHVSEAVLMSVSRRSNGCWLPPVDHRVLNHPHGPGAFTNLISSTGLVMDKRNVTRDKQLLVKIMGLIMAISMHAKPQRKTARTSKGPMERDGPPPPFLFQG